MAIILVLILSTATFVSMKGSRVLMTLFAVDLGAGPFETGMLFALYGLVPFLLVVSAGRIADRFDNRVLMYWGLGGFTATLTLPFLFPALPTLFITAPLTGFTTMLFVVATQNLIGMLSTSRTRTRNFSYYSLGESSANIAGPVCVGLSIDQFHHPVTFLFLALFTAGCGLLLVATRGALPRTGNAQEKQDTPRSMKDLLALPAMRNALITNGVVMAGVDLFSLYMPVYARGIGLSATAIGLIIGAFGAAAFIIRLEIPPVTARWGERVMLTWALALSAIAFVTFPLTTRPLLLGMAAFLLGLGLGCGQPLSMILAFNASPPGRSAEGIAMRLAVSYGAHVVIPPVFGAIGTGLGLAPIFWTCAMLLGGGSLINRRQETVNRE
ncbi:MAG TPA: MFS transporter [Burkholderiales bacterium]|nr:MFS transporter [Burkholderiales bacterium]